MASRSPQITLGRITAETLTCGDVEVDCAARVVHVAGRRQLLTFGEFEILLRLVQCHGRVLKREELHIGSDAQTESSLRAVDTLIARLRRKLRGAQLFQIETVQRIGYRGHWVTSSVMTLGNKASHTRTLASRESALPVAMEG